MSNSTCEVADFQLCTVDTCPLSCGYITYLPTLPGNITYAACFGVLIIAQLGLGIAYRTWAFMACMVLGLIGEVIGYAGRILLHEDPFSFENFIIYLVSLTVAPVLMAAGIYLCLSRIIVVYGSSIPLLSPRIVALTFMCSDIISLILQGTGGALAGSADTLSTYNAAISQLDTGTDIMIAGLIFQVVSLIIFLSLGVHTAMRIRRSKEADRDDRFARLRGVARFRMFPYALGTATVLIFVRSVYRVAELWQGFEGPIDSDEVLFMVLDGPMVWLAVVLLTVCHPGVAFCGEWKKANWTLRRKEGRARGRGSRDSNGSSYSMSERPFAGGGDAK